MTLTLIPTSRILITSLLPPPTPLSPPPPCFPCTPLTFTIFTVRRTSRTPTVSSPATSSTSAGSRPFLMRQALPRSWTDDASVVSEASPAPAGFRDPASLPRSVNDTPVEQRAGRASNDGVLSSQRGPCMVKCSFGWLSCLIF